MSIKIIESFSCVSASLSVVNELNSDNVSDDNHGDIDYNNDDDDIDDNDDDNDDKNDDDDDGAGLI